MGLAFRKPRCNKAAKQLNKKLEAKGETYVINSEYAVTLDAGALISSTSDS